MKAEYWNNLIASLPGAHVLQSWEWGQVKQQYHWQPVPLVWYAKEGNSADLKSVDLSVDGGRKFTLEGNDKLSGVALALQRTIALSGFSARLRIIYVPKGPVLADWSDEVLRHKVMNDLRLIGHRRGAIFIKIDPDVPTGSGVPGESDAQEVPEGHEVIRDLQERGWRFSGEQVQFRNTVLVDLTASEEEILARMKQKTRYNIRLSTRKGVSIRVGTRDDIDLLYRMYAETALRDGFVIREEGYYQTVWNRFFRSRDHTGDSTPNAEPLIAEVAGESVAAVIVFRFAEKAWYLYGMSILAHREKMPNYLLQWEAMRRAKLAGCTVYDLWGAPDAFHEGDSLWGVYRFKSGLGGQVIRTIGAWDLPLRPFYFRLYTRVLPRILAGMRLRASGRAKKIRLGGA
jgi:peptidoglycan pentaglycine glycine transferase (the first glycine)